MTPTSEQQECIDVFMDGRNMKINAFAGSGKTSTLKLLAQGRVSPGIYLCFNRSIAEEAQKSFPQSVACKTTHSNAYRAVARSYSNNRDKMGGSLYARDTESLLKLKDYSVFGGTERLAGSTIAYAVNQTIRRFCLSAAREMGNEHFFIVPKFKTLPDDEFRHLRTRVLEWAKTMWEQMSDPSSTVPLGHDGYVKMWQLGDPIMDTCYVLVDEAQDTNPVMLDVLSRQTCQVVYVGDKHQQIYEWRGAINAMEVAQAERTINLTKSFRFGQRLADFASDILSTIGETCRITGNETITSRIVDAGQRVVLCRTNASILETLLNIEEHEPDKSAFVVGGVEDLLKCLSGVERLLDKKPSAYPMFLGFKDWQDFLVYAQKSGDGEAEKIVKLVDKYGVRQLKSALENVNPAESRSDLLLTTAHKAKGREWEGVELAEDFKAQPTKDRDTQELVYDQPETRLFYVAATRAIKHLKVPSWALETYATTLDKPLPVEEAPVEVDKDPF